MKGKDIIEYAVRGEMPDLEQMREKCTQQATNTTYGHKRRIQWSTAAACLLAFLVFSTAVYAAVVFIGQRFDTGGSTEFIFVDEEGWDEFWEDALFGDTIYRSPSSIARDGAFFIAVEPQYWRQFDHDTAQMVNEMLAGKVFTADGNPFLLIVPIADWEGYSPMYRADDRGYTLFDAYGDEIDTINLLRSRGDDTPQWVHIDNETDAIARGIPYSDTFEDVVRVLGDVRLPNPEGFDEPVFEVRDVPGHYVDTGYNEIWIPENRRVFIRYRLTGQSWHMGSMFMLWIEPVRPETEEPYQLPVLYGEIHEHTIANTPIYEITGDGQILFFVWQHNGLVHRLHPMDVLTTAQSMEIIRSMVE